MGFTSARPSTSAPEAISPFAPNTWMWILTGVMAVGTFFVGGPFLLERARKLQAATAIKGLTIAVNGFDTEYGRSVPPYGFFGEKLGLSESRDLPFERELLDTLMSRTLTHNPRKVRFYDPAMGKKQKSGYWIDTAGESHLSDPWGSAYLVRADIDGDGLIPDPEISGATVGAKYIVYSSGVDGDPSTWHDNIRSWK
jgi:hypothetical protein